MGLGKYEPKSHTMEDITFNVHHVTQKKVKRTAMFTGKEFVVSIVLATYF